ncbi:uncharacterized protein SLC66A1L [Dromaius novaehollandiae]|uniref:uncharacterized protein SLC66A1L n=1 Tax=Dromaius novaehollandiae TaxID=8790 RepID=UPI00311E19C9
MTSKGVEISYICPLQVSYSFPLSCSFMRLKITVIPSICLDAESFDGGYSALIVTAIFYVSMDIIQISQFVYYKLKNQKMTKFVLQVSVKTG